MTPIQRSLKKLRAEGWTCAIVEKWNPHVKIRQDLFGFGDLLCFREWVAMIVQTTTGDHVAERFAKIKENPLAKSWLWGDSRIIVIHGWRKVGPRGKAKKWECREVSLYAAL